MAFHDGEATENCKKLLKPETGVLIVTIDEHEVHHLRTLLDQVLPEAYIQMVTIVNNPKGSTRGFFQGLKNMQFIVLCPKLPSVLEMIPC